MELSLWFPTYFAVRILSFIIMAMLLYPALRSAKHRTLISLYILECLSDVNTIVYLAVASPSLKYTDTSSYTPDAVCIFSAYAGRFIAIYRSVLLLALCLNLWMAVHKPNTNADREWFKWYILAATILSLLGSLPIFLYIQHYSPNTNGQTLYADFSCYINSRLPTSQAVTGVTFGLNIISMLLLFHTTFDVLKHKFKVNAAQSVNIERTLQSRIVVRMIFCSTIAVIVVLWLDLESMIAAARNANDTIKAPTNDSLNIFLGIINALFYFLAFGTTVEFAKTYCCCLIPALSKVFKGRRKSNDSCYSNRQPGIASLPRIKLSLQGSVQHEGEWQELESIHENVDHDITESKHNLSSYHGA